LAVLDKPVTVVTAKNAKVSVFKLGTEDREGEVYFRYGLESGSKFTSLLNSPQEAYTSYAENREVEKKKMEEKHRRLMHIEDGLKRRVMRACICNRAVLRADAPMEECVKSVAVRDVVGDYFQFGFNMGVAVNSPHAVYEECMRNDVSTMARILEGVAEAEDASYYEAVQSCCPS
jgi:hypothetical protein